MAQASITININTPVGMAAAEALRLFTDARGFNPELPETRAAYAKRVITDDVKEDIRDRREYEAKAAVTVPDDITVD
jgi:hypothetical protein